MNVTCSTLSGNVVIERNWLDVYPWERWLESTLPNLQEGQNFVPSSLTLEQGQTQPPDLL